MTVAFIVVVILALVPQLLFTVLYWKWIPTWTKNPYGRLAQFGSWSISLTLILCLILATIGKRLSQQFLGEIFVIGFLPLLTFGYMQLYLLKKAVESASKEREEAQQHDN